jgi:uncharacterized RDD family membrane protein YckC
MTAAPDSDAPDVPDHGVEHTSALPSWTAAVPPQARSFQGHRAGFLTRAAAAGVDFVAVAIVLGLLYVGWVVLLFTLNPTSVSPPRLSFPVVLAASAFANWLALTTAWSTTGRSVGARLMGIRVVSYQGRVMRLPGAAVRAAFCLGFLPGLFWVIVSKENRSLQDTVLRTSVIHDWTKRAPKKEQRPRTR